MTRTIIVFVPRCDGPYPAAGNIERQGADSRSRGEEAGGRGGHPSPEVPRPTIGLRRRGGPRALPAPLAQGEGMIENKMLNLLLQELVYARGPCGQEDEVRVICKRELA